MTTTLNRYYMLAASALLRPEELNCLDQQLERIFSDPLFSEAEILRKFLKFIVVETHNGRSDRLKEYTIATNVLGKPTHFRPQENGIVRIHAGRLRRALELYYAGPGCNDELIILIPKGRYVPEFTTRKQTICRSSEQHFFHEGYIETQDTRTLAVVPFLCDENEIVAGFFTDGICIQLGNSLMQLKNTHVISYQTIKGMTSVMKDLRELQRSAGCNYLISGGIQYVNHRIRITLQLFQTASGHQLWSSVFERSLTKTNVLRVQDELVKEMNMAISEALTPLERRHEAEN